MIKFEPEVFDNRRTDKRVNYRDSVRFQHSESSELSGSVGFDISESGIRMRFNDYVPIGTELSLFIQLGGQMIECTGKVVWVKKYPYSDHYQAGLQFESPENSIDSRTKIHHHIESFQS